MLPTAPTVYSTAQVLANPIELNSRLGTYTNFVNLLDLCGLALPAAMRPDGIPFGITLLAPAGQDAQLASDRPRLPCRHADCRWARAACRSRRSRRLSAGVRGDEIAIAVVGAHLSGMALNGELKALGGAPAGAAPDRAGLPALCARHHAAEARHAARRARERDRRSSWNCGRCRPAVFGKFVAAIPPPLSIGTVRLADGRSVKGFIVEAADVDGARDISAFGGWRAFVAEAAAG